MKIINFWHQSIQFTDIKVVLFITFILTLLPRLTQSYSFADYECYDVYAFPKLIGRNNSGFNTSIYGIKYDNQADRTAIAALTNDPQKCQGAPQCHFIVMYQGMYLDLQWQKAIMNVNDEMLLSFSQDGSQLAFFILENQVLALIDSSDGKVRASVSKNNAKTLSIYKNFLPNIVVKSYANGLNSSEIYVQLLTQQLKDSLPIQSLQISKFMENFSSKTLDLIWSKQIQADSFFQDSVLLISKNDQLFSFVHFKSASSQNQAFISGLNLNGDFNWGIKSGLIDEIKYVEQYSNSASEVQFYIFDSNTIQSIGIKQGEVLSQGTYQIYGDIGSFRIYDSKFFEPSSLDFLLQNVTQVIYCQLQNLQTSPSLSLRVYIIHNPDAVYNLMPVFYRSQFQFLLISNNNHFFRDYQRINFNLNQVGLLLYSNQNIGFFRIASSQQITLQRNQSFIVPTTFIDNQIFSSQNYQQQTVEGFKNNSIIDKMIGNETETNTENKFDISSQIILDFNNISQSVYQFNWTRRCTYSKANWTSDQFDFQIFNPDYGYQDANNYITCSSLFCNITVQNVNRYFGSLYPNREFLVKLKPKYYPIDRWSENQRGAKVKLVSTPYSKIDFEVYDLNSTHQIFSLKKLPFGWESGFLNITHYKIIQRSVNNTSVDKVLGTIFDSQPTNYQNNLTFTTSLELNKELLLSIIPVNQLGEGKGNFQLFFNKLVKTIPKSVDGKPMNIQVYKTPNNESFVIDWSNSTTYQFLTYYKISIKDEWAGQRRYNYPQPPQSPTSTNKFEQYCNGTSQSVISSKRCEVKFQDLATSFQFQGGERIIVILNNCNPHGCTEDIMYSDVRNHTAPYHYPQNVDFDPKKTNLSSIALVWQNLSFDSYGSGGINCDYMIRYLNVYQQYYAYLDTVQNSTIYQTSAGISHQQSAEIQFQIQPFNYLGTGSISAYITFVYNVPKPPSFPLRGDKTNQTCIHVKIPRQPYSDTSYQDILSYDLYQRNASNPQSQFTLVLQAQPPYYNNFEYFYTNNVKSGDVFEFKMKTKNSFGYSLYSGEASHPTSTSPPTSPAPPQPYSSTTFVDNPGRVTAYGPPFLTGIQGRVQNVGAFIQFSWENAISFGGIPPKDIIVNFRSCQNGCQNESSYQFNGIDMSCDIKNVTIQTKQYCQFHMQTLNNYCDYLYKTGDIIYLNLTFYNDIGNVTFKNFSFEAIKKTKPSNPVEGLIQFDYLRSNETNARIFISNNESLITYGFDKNIQYLIYANYQLVYNFTYLTDEKFSNFSLISSFYFSYTPQLSYLFFFRISNQFGITDYPQQKTISFNDNLILNQSPFLYREQYSSGVRLIIPVNNFYSNSQTIVERQLLIRNQQSEEFHLSSDSYYDIVTKQYNISALILLEPPFNLQVGDLIKFRVRVRNYLGWTSFEENFYQFFVYSKPFGRLTLQQDLEKTTFESIFIQWDNLTYPENGGENKTQYRAYWGEGKLSSQWNIFYEGEQPYAILNKKARENPSLKPSTSYKFKVRAYNSYGEGPESTVLYAMTASNNNTNYIGIEYLFPSFFMLLSMYC